MKENDGGAMQLVCKRKERPTYIALVPLRFVVISSLATALMAFGLGRIARSVILPSVTHPESKLGRNTGMLLRDDDAVAGFNIWDASQGITTFTAPSRPLEEEPTCEDSTDRETPVARCGQLLTTIRFLSREQLVSEKKIQETFVEIARRSNLNLLFHHCIQRTSGGLMCTVGLSDSKFIIATWPEYSEATFDVSVCGVEDNRDWMVTGMLPIIKDVYKQHSKDTESKPLVEWIFKHRGFREEDELDNPYDADLETLLHRGKIIAKEHLASVQTTFQRVDIYNFAALPGHEALRAYGRDPSVVDTLPKNRVVLLDYVLQSTLLGDAAYHEALVHPALFAHANPRRVAVIGGGEGATLREILRHDTIERAVMVEIDEGMVNASRIHLPEWSDCSNIVGSEKSCFEDVRAETYYEDAIAWFISRYGENAKPTSGKEDGFDVIIMDALDPNSVVDFSDLLYDNTELMAAFSNALGDDGILVVQVGESDSLSDLPSEYGSENRLLTFRQHLIDIGFRDIVEYSEPHCGFEHPWSYQVAMKNPDSVSRFFDNEAAVNLAIARRLRATVDGKPSLRYFDGATMASYQQPSRVVEDIWCITDGANCHGKHGFDPSKAEIRLGASNVRLNDQESGEGPSLLTSEPIPANSYLDLHESTHSLLITPSSYALLKNASFDARAKMIFEHYGMESTALGKSSLVLPGGPLMFAERDQSKEEQKQSQESESHMVYNPFARRHFSHPLAPCSLLNIKRGGEKISMGDKVQTNDQHLWMDPSFH